MSIQGLLQMMSGYAESQGFRINPEKKILDFVLTGLLHNEQKFGRRYCPCRAITGEEEHDRKITCPCVYHCEEIKRMGRCLCGLFVAK